MYKFIAMDLDGTLMAEDHVTVTERTRRALKAAHDMGVKIAIATGRTLNVTENVLNQIPFTDYVIYSNGAAVYSCGEKRVIYSNYMKKETVETVVDFLERYPVFYEVYSGGRQHSENRKAKYFKNNGMPQEFVDDYTNSITVHDSVAQFAKSHDIEKINLFYFEFDSVYYEEIRSFLFSLKEIDCTSPVMGDIEMTTAGVDKAGAIDGICKKYGIKKAEAMAFGDADNDIEMLNYCGLGIAMANASDVCKQAANYVTLSNAEDGVAAAVEKFILNEGEKTPNV